MRTPRSAAGVPSRLMGYVAGPGSRPDCGGVVGGGREASARRAPTHLHGVGARRGCSLSGAGFIKRDMEAAAGVVIVPDPATFDILPWAIGTGWLLCDLYFTSGQPVPISTRYLYRRALERLGEAGFDYVAGLEVEFHIFKLENPRLSLHDSGQSGPPPEDSRPPQGDHAPPELRFDHPEPLLHIP